MLTTAATTPANDPGTKLRGSDHCGHGRASLIADGSATVGHPTDPSMTSAAQPVVSPDGPISVAASRDRGRDRYIDTLRVLALARVIAYHVTGWVLLPIVFPSMGIMFALAGSLMAASLDRSPLNPWRVLGKRLRRMLPPLWALGAVLVTIMLLSGWHATEDLGTEFSWSTILFWLIPVVDPPASIQGSEWVIPLWYIRAYLWFVLTSPILLWCFRRWHWRTLAAPLVVLLGYGAGLVPLKGAEGDIVLDWAVFGACWILGFAHHDRLIRTIPVARLLPVAVALIAAGLGWAFLFPDPLLGFAIADIPVADGLYCLGFVLILLRIYPDFGWMARFRRLDMLICAINQRAMTIYLWGNPCIAAAFLLLAEMPAVDDAMAESGLRSIALVLTLTWALIGLAVLAFGWVEDIAADRPVRLLPLSRRGGRHAERAAERHAPAQSQVAAHPLDAHASAHRPDQLRPQAATS